MATIQIKTRVLVAALLLLSLQVIARDDRGISPFIHTTNLETIQKEATQSKKAHHQSKKQWTFIVYIAADNDLRAFAARNIKQMSAIGSNEHINIIIHLDIRVARDHKITRRYYIEKNKVLHVNPNDAETGQMDRRQTRLTIVPNQRQESY